LLFGNILEDFKNKKYKKVCTIENIRKNINNENILSIIGVACVRVDKIYLLPVMFYRLKKTSKSRKNLIYFNTIYFQKRLLYSFLFDNLDITEFNFPMTDYILSKIFDAIKNKKYVLKNSKYIIKDGNLTYHFYKEDDKMIIDTFKKNKILKRQWFR